MKKINKSKTVVNFAYIAIFILVAAMFTPVVAADTSNMNQNITQNRQVINAQEPSQTVEKNLDENKNYLQNANRFHLQSRNQFLAVKEKFNNARTIENGQELKNATEDYLNDTIEYMILRIESIKEKAEAEGDSITSAILSEKINDLEDLKEDVAAAETGADFQDITKEIKNIWNHINISHKYLLIETVISKTDGILEHYESISDRVINEIESQEDADVDTARLRLLFDEFNTSLADANMHYKHAYELYNDNEYFDEDGNPVDIPKTRMTLNEVNIEIKKTNLALRQANSNLRIIFTELKDYRPGLVTLGGTGLLKASGDGKATLSGDLDIDISAKNGTLIIIDYQNDCVIDITGNGTKEEMGDNTVKYSGFDGNANISGSGITVAIEGNGIELTAEGTGSAILCGIGTYSVESENEESTIKDWSSPINPQDEEVTEESS